MENTSIFRFTIVYTTVCMLLYFCLGTGIVPLPSFLLEGNNAMITVLLVVSVAAVLTIKSIMTEKV